MVIYRRGKYGAYYGSPYNKSSEITIDQMKINAYYISLYLKEKGWTVESISGLLGNMEAESGLNPGRWQGDNVGIGPAYGLVQWDPWTKYTSWCTENGLLDPSLMDNNLARIIYELEHNEQYISTEEYPLGFLAFTQSKETPYYLACAFAWNYEKSAVVIEGTDAQKEALRQARGGNAEFWYSFLTNEQPPMPPPALTRNTRKRKFSFNSKYAVLTMIKNRRM